MSDETLEFYQAHLDRVSRSFAFCISQLPSPLRDWVGLAYLLCRVVDTIEDAPWTDVGAQLEAYACFDRAVTSRSDLAAVATLADRLPVGITDDERALLKDGPRLIGDFHDLPAAARSKLEGPIRSMSAGMQHFSRRKPLILADLREVNQYCFFVAGVVGEMLAGLLAEVEPRFEVSPSLLRNAHHFGQFLQKVNVLKDQVDDRTQGRNLVPSRDVVEASVWVNAERAFGFILAVPQQQLEFRRFCAWSFFMGLESLSLARESLAQGRVLSIPRERNVVLLGQVEDVLHDDRGLTKLYREFLDRLKVEPKFEVALPPSAPPAWFTRLYDGPLDAEGLRDLGL